MIEAIKVDEVGIEVSVEGSKAEGGTRSHSSIFVDEFVQVKVSVTNRTARPIYPLLRLMPALCHRPLNIALDFTRKFAWNGTLQQSLPMLDPHAAMDVIIGATALCRGGFEFTASVEEIQVWEEPKKGPEKREGGRSRSDTQTMLDAALGAKERRIWHSRQPCIVQVSDRDSIDTARALEA
jgi:hypothetical protein